MNRFLSGSTSTSVLLVLLVLLAGSMPMPAESHRSIRPAKTTGIYLGLSHNTFSPECCEEPEFESTSLRVGSSFNSYLSAEGRLGLNATDERQTVPDIEMHRSVSAFLKIKYPSYIVPYALLGRFSADATICNFGCFDQTLTGAAMGYGVIVPIRRDYTMGIFAEYLEYHTNINHVGAIDLESVQMGLQYSF